jgi:RNA polymerase sigma-70 factor, ECF subfamily
MGINPAEHLRHHGLPGLVAREGDGQLQTTALEIEDDKIAAMYIVRNPNKVRHLH